LQARERKRSGTDGGKCGENACTNRGKKEQDAGSKGRKEIKNVQRRVEGGDKRNTRWVDVRGGRGSGGKAKSRKFISRLVR